MPKNLVLLGGGVEAVPIIHRAKSLGCTAIVVDIDGRCPACLDSDVFVQASCYHGDQVVEALTELSVEADVTFDGVMCAATDAPVACAMVAEAFGLPGLSVEAAKLGQDKWEQIYTLTTNGIKTPYAFVLEKEYKEYPKWGGVIKPLDSRGGRGVVRLLPGVDPAFAYEIAKANSPTGRVMVEEWLDGPQLSTESIIQDGKVLFTAVGLRNYDRIDEFDPFCIEDGFDEPWPYQAWRDDGDGKLKIDNETIDTVIESACRALGWYQRGAGTVKGDLVIHDGRVYVIELACRLSGGFFATHGHELAYGVDFVGAAIKAALGYTLEPPAPYARQFVCQRYVFPDKGDVGKVVKDIIKPDLDVFSTYNIRIGQVVEAVTSHPERWGQALATGKTPEEAQRKATEAARAMKAGVVLI